jgi:phospholipase C
MAKHTKTAYECSPLNAENKPVAQPREKDNPIPAKVGDPSPIKYCIYIVKENRTYDQVFGDMPEGNGDKDLCIFPERVTPNHHALAREFVLLDNFYVESEVSADGHEWSMAAYATDFTEKTWPLLYRGGLGKLKYPSEGVEVAASAGGYIWDRCQEAGVSFRSYGEFINNASKPGERATPRLKSLEGKFDPEYHGYDLNYPDQKRADRFIAEVQRFEKEGDMPRMQIVRLPNDHTQGTVVGKPTPTAMVADNDLALGRVIEALSNTRFWKETAVFVVQDDAQNGSDHVDAHRTVALVISPYTKRKYVDSNMYSTASMLRTMELILGLKPMSQFDAAALPMYDSFQAKRDLTPYKHRPAQVDLMLANKPDAWGAKLSAKMDFSREDAADDLLLNEVVWRSVRGPNSRMPAPVRASFVFSVPEDEEEEEEED